MNGIDSSSGRNSASDCKYVGPEFKLVRSGVFPPLPLPLSCGFYCRTVWGDSIGLHSVVQTVG